jgi:hypothetical protein
MYTMQLRKIIGYLQKLIYTVKRIRMSPTPTLNIFLWFLNQKTNIHVNFGNVLWVEFSIPSGSLSLNSVGYMY